MQKLIQLQARTQLFRRGGGLHFKLERTSCQQSLKYIYLCIIRKVQPFLVKKETCFCVIKIRSIIPSLSIGNCKPGGSRSELVQQK